MFVPSDSAADKRLATGGTWEPIVQKSLGSQLASSEMVASKIPEKRGHALIAKHEGLKSSVATKTTSKESRVMNYNAGKVAADETDAKNNQHVGGSAGVASRCSEASSTSTRLKRRGQMVNVSFYEAGETC